MGNNGLVDIRPIADIVMKLIDKVSDAVGWVATPHGSKADYETAVQHLIQQVQQNENLSPLEKSACIAKSRKILKEYINQNNIVNSAMEYLSEDAEPEKVDEDWLNQFFEYAKNISREDMQKVWSKVLSGECNAPGSIPKSLFQILANMDSEDARLYQTLAQFTVVDCEGRQFVIIDPFDDFCKSKGFSFMALSNLAATQLIQIRAAENPFLEKNEVVFYYLSKRIILRNPSKPKIPVGNVILIKNGQALYDLFDHDQIPEFIDYLTNYYKRQGCEVTISEL